MKRLLDRTVVSAAVTSVGIERIGNGVPCLVVCLRLAMRELSFIVARLFLTAAALPRTLRVCTAWRIELVLEAGEWTATTDPRALWCGDLPLARVACGAEEAGGRTNVVRWFVDVAAVAPPERSA